MSEHYDYFLVLYKESYDYDLDRKKRDKILDFLKNEGFKFLGGGACPWYFIDIINKSYYAGKAGVKFGRVVGEHAITFSEFKIIYGIYMKYKGLGPVDMPKRKKLNNITNSEKNK